jgi:hypothetical protein
VAADHVAIVAVTVTANKLALGRSLQARVEQRDGVSWVALIGNVDESVDLAPLIAMAGPLVVDLGEMDRINSIGVRTWMNFVKAREKAGAALTIERCSPMMVGQITMITRFMGSQAHVKSLLVPYFCKKCQREHAEVFAAVPGASVSPTIACPNCGGQMELDEFAQTYDEALRRLTL